LNEFHQPAIFQPQLLLSGGAHLNDCSACPVIRDYSELAPSNLNDDSRGVSRVQLQWHFERYEMAEQHRPALESVIARWEGRNRESPGELAVAGHRYRSGKAKAGTPQGAIEHFCVGTLGPSCRWRGHCILRPRRDVAADNH